MPFLKKQGMKPHSLSVKIFLAMMILLIVTISVVSFIWYTNASNSLERNAKEYLFSGVETVNTQLDSFLQMINGTANNIAYGYPQYRYVITNGPYSDLGVYMQQVRDIENNILKNIFAFSYNLNGVSIISRSGYMIKAGYLITTSNEVDQPFINKALTGKYKVVYMRQNRKGYPNADSEVLSMVVPIRFQGEVAGVVLMDLNYKRMLNIYSLQIKKFNGTGQGVRIISVLPEGQVLYDSYEQAKDTQKAGNAAPDAANFFPADKAADFSGNIRIEGKDYLVVRMGAAYTGITTVGIIPIAELRSQINSGYVWTLAGVFLIALLAMTITFLITKQTTKNLQSLKQTMIRVGKDGVGIRARLEGNDEIAQLADTFNMMMQRVEELMYRISQEEKALHRMELDVFRSQINPHFLYNTLITIRHLAKLRGARNIDEVALSLSKLLRASLDRTNEFSTLAEEMEMLQNYMNIQRYLYSENILLAFQFEPGLEQALLPKMILQPLVENALFHGYGGSKKEGPVAITGEICRQDLWIHIRDEGEGICETKIRELLSLSESDGIDPDGRIHVGIKNVHRRLQLYYGTDYGLSIESSPGEYTKVTARIPLQWKQAEEPACSGRAAGNSERDVACKDIDRESRGIV